MNRLSGRSISWAPPDRIGFASRDPQLKVHAHAVWHVEIGPISDAGTQDHRPFATSLGPQWANATPSFGIFSKEIFQPGRSGGSRTFSIGRGTLRLRYAPFDRAASRREFEHGEVWDVVAPSVGPSATT